MRSIALTGYIITDRKSNPSNTLTRSYYILSSIFNGPQFVAFFSLTTLDRECCGWKKFISEINLEMFCWVIFVKMPACDPVSNYSLIVITVIISLSAPAPVSGRCREPTEFGGTWSLVAPSTTTLSLRTEGPESQSDLVDRRDFIVRSYLLPV